MPPLMLLSALIFLVNVLGGAPGHKANRRAKMISIHSLSELERLKLQETAYHELVARQFLSEFKPDRGEQYPGMWHPRLRAEWTLRAGHWGFGVEGWEGFSSGLGPGRFSRLLDNRGSGT